MEHSDEFVSPPLREPEPPRAASGEQKYDKVVQDRMGITADAKREIRDMVRDEVRIDAALAEQRKRQIQPGETFGIGVEHPDDD